MTVPTGRVTGPGMFTITGPPGPVGGLPLMPGPFGGVPGPFGGVPGLPPEGVPEVPEPFGGGAGGEPGTGPPGCWSGPGVGMTTNLPLRGAKLGFVTWFNGRCQMMCEPCPAAGRPATLWLVKRLHLTTGLRLTVG